MFSSNVNDELKRKIVDGLGVIVAENPGTYLGIPSLWGKTKVKAMAFLKEKVQGRTQH